MGNKVGSKKGEIDILLAAQWIPNMLPCLLIKMKQSFVSFVTGLKGGKVYVLQSFQE